jgi:hypothetical protein
VRAAAQAILRDQAGVLHVRLIARHEDRVAWMTQSVDLTRDGVGLTRAAAVERLPRSPRPSSDRHGASGCL